MRGYYYMTMICAALMLGACAQEIEQVDVYELGCPEETVGAEAQAGSKTFEIYANGEYEGTVDADWISVDEFPGQRSFTSSGDGALTLSFGHNEGDTRTGTVTLTRFTRTVTLTLVQKGDLTVDPGVTAENVAFSSSTLTFRFGEGDTVEQQYKYAYSFGLYSDEALENPIVTYSVPGGTLIWNKAAPAFTFGGLESGKDYYFHVSNPDTGKESQVIKARTSDFEVVEAGTVPMAENVVIFAEDFSELPWNGDEVNAAAGWRAEDIGTFAMPSGCGPVGYFGNRSYECPLIHESGCGAAMSSSRLKDWSVADQPGAPAGKTVFVRPGYLKLGGYSYVPALVTPELGEVPFGRLAVLKVEFTASRYSSDNPSVVVAAVKGTADGNVFNVDNHVAVQRIDVGSSVDWGKYEVTLDGVGSDTRILIGPDAEKTGNGNGTSQQRIFLDDIKVTVAGLEEVLGLTVKPYFSDALLAWNAVDADSYDIYLDGEKVAETVDSSYHFKDLDNETSYTVKVTAMSGGSEKISETITFKTYGVRVVEQARTHICVEWDDLVTTPVKTTTKTDMSEGQDRAYIMELYADEACTRLLVTLHPYDGVNNKRFAFNDGMGNGSSQYWNGIVGGVPRRVATRVSIGCLEPETDYWFRVRSVEELDVTGPKGDAKMTNPAGTSEWSAPQKLTTASARTAVAGEILYRGFDEFTIQKDMHNQCPGIQPRVSSETERLGFAADTDKLSYGFGLCSYYGMGHFYKIHQFGFVTALAGSDTSYETGAKYEGITNRVEEASGWHFIGNISPEMGYLHIDATAGIGLGTPALDSSLLSESGTDCTLSFKAFAVHSSCRKGASVTINVRILRDGTAGEPVALTLPYRYTNTNPSANDFIPDTEWVTLSTDLNLKPGDVVLIQNGVDYRFMIDDILIVKK